MWAARMIGSVLLLSLASSRLVSAQSSSIVPSNSTTNGYHSANGDIAIEVTHGSDHASAGTFDLMPLTSQASDLQPNYKVTGQIVLANETSQLTLSDHSVALINCDQYSGLIQAINVFNTATQTNVSAIVLYSKSEPGCSLQNVETNYAQIYTMKSSTDATNLVNLVNSLDSGDPSAAGAVIALNSTLAAGANGNSQSTSSNSQQQSATPWNSPPSTAVAMIILYSITGVITALFLVIIITGAVRAHRHPERYGPRNIMGRPRQSRARGLARAMLETLPIVRFGEREDEQQRHVKPTDVELAEGQTGTAEIDPTPRPHTTDTTTREAGQEAVVTLPSGIAAANTSPRPEITEPESQGCSICTDDFEIGQDQRVLPCNHRFHPECIDPWLLNISGTCPLCRIDLRPQTGDDDDAEVELDAHGNSIPRGAEDSLAPPLEAAGGHRRSSVRRSLLIGLTATLGHRPDGMTQEQRIAALREYTLRHRARPRDPAATTSEEEEGGRRRRLRNAFRVRTRRIGEEQEEGEGRQLEEREEGQRSGSSPTHPS